MLQYIYCCSFPCRFVITNNTASGSENVTIWVQPLFSLREKVCWSKHTWRCRLVGAGALMQWMHRHINWQELWNTTLVAAPDIVRLRETRKLMGNAASQLYTSTHHSSLRSRSPRKLAPLHKFLPETNGNNISLLIRIQ